MSKSETVRAYGPGAGAVLADITPHLDAALSSFVVDFYEDLSSQTGPSAILSQLNTDEIAHLHEQQANHLRQLFDGTLDECTHRRSARMVGKIHALTGVDPGWIVDAYEHYRKIVLDLCNSSQRDYRLFREILDARLSVELHEQLDAPRELQDAQHNALHQIDQLVNSATTFTDLAAGILDILVKIEGIETGAISRPDAQGNLHYEVTAGEKVKRYLEMLAIGQASHISIHADRPTGRGPSGRAWRSGKVEHTLSMSLDPGMVIWRDMLKGFHLRSAATIPVLDNDDRPQLLIQLWSNRTAHFATSLRQTLIEHLQRALGPAFTRLMYRDQQNTVVIPHGRRLEWRELLQYGALEMHYQPIINLVTGDLHKVEALARLRNPDGSLIHPGDFLPAFGEWELQRLFEQGLSQGITALGAWDAAEIATTISINFPPQGLKDRRYIDILREALSKTGLNPNRLTLELLETGKVEQISTQRAIVDELRSIGVHLAEDDLGAGYSSLLRMDSIEFDEMKIDQGLVSNSTHTPRKALGFIHYLTRLSHDFGIPVTVEGLENQGLVEAAVILSANMGQGFALAHPMMRDELPHWHRHFRFTVDQTQPKTALGAFATSMLWHLQLVSLSPWQELLANFLRMPSSLSYYIADNSLRGTALHVAHDALYAAAAAYGPSDAAYWNARETMERLLAERITLENE